MQRAKKNSWKAIYTNRTPVLLNKNPPYLVFRHVEVNFQEEEDGEVSHLLQEMDQNTYGD